MQNFGTHKNSFWEKSSGGRKKEEEKKAREIEQESGTPL
jgi:hypothetical protein